jgi:hypothetical protein
VFTVLREILGRVVDEMASAKRAHELEVAAARDPSHLGAEVTGELHGEAPDPAGGAEDEHLVTAAHRTEVAHEGQCRQGAVGYRRGLVVAEAAGDRRHGSVFRHGEVLGVSAMVGATEHVIADRKARDGAAHRNDSAGEDRALNRLPRLEDADHEAPGQR